MSNIFMFAPNIKGNVSSKNYQDWIAIDSLNFTVNRNIKMQTGKRVNREHECPQFTEAEVSKRLDNSSNHFFHNACVGQALEKIEIHVCKTGVSLQPYAKYLFSNVIISHHSHHIVTESYPYESLRLNFSKIEITYIGAQSQGESLSPNTIGYDLNTAGII